MQILRTNNKIEFEKFLFSNQLLFKQAMEIRTQVFVKEQNVPPELEYDGFDSEAVHFLGKLELLPVAVARIRTTDKGFKLERFAVSEDYRSSGFGRMLMDFIYQSYSKEQIYFHSQDGAVRFYQNLGYVIVGDAFYEAGIKHYLMKYKSNIQSIG